MNINEYIEGIGSKYGYTPELVDALKKCVPVMMEGKTHDEIRLLMETLDRVQIF